MFYIYAIDMAQYMFYISSLKVKLTHDISDNMAIITLY